MATFAEHKKILKDLQVFKPQIQKAVDAMGVLAANHFTRSFSNGGFTDETFVPWKKRKRGYETYKRGKRGESGVRSMGIDRGILIGKRILSTGWSRTNSCSNTGVRLSTSAGTIRLRVWPNRTRSPCASSFQLPPAVVCAW